MGSFGDAFVKSSYFIAKMQTNDLHPLDGEISTDQFADDTTPVRKRYKLTRKNHKPPQFPRHGRRAIPHGCRPIPHGSPAIPQSSPDIPQSSCAKI
jgi:hypothetical protein